MVLAGFLILGCAAKSVPSSSHHANQAPIKSFLESYVELFGSGKSDELREYMTSDFLKNFGKQTPMILANESPAESSRVEIEQVVPTKPGQYFVRWKFENSAEPSKVWYQLVKGGAYGFQIQDITSEFDPSSYSK